MKTILPSLVLLGFLGQPDLNRLIAVDPPPSQPQKGKVLVLKNEHTMEGDIELVGERYRVRRLIGETWVPVDRVQCLAASLPEAYKYLRARANGADADEHIRLANWCRLNGLREQALAEIRAAVKLRPDHGETRRILQHLQQSATTTVAKPTAPNVEAAEPATPIDLTADSLGLFATRVQPILMNTCANCHATGRGGKFRLTQAYGDGLSNRRTLERNLAAVLAEINLNQPESSRLLTKAVSDHAHAGHAPIKSRKDAPYRTLEKWVQLTVANNPLLRDSQPSSPAPATPQPTTTPKQRPSIGATESQWGADSGSPSAPAVPSIPSVLPIPLSKPATAPPPVAGPVDPYDPEPFNRKSHPELTQPGPKK